MDEQKEWDNEVDLADVRNTFDKWAEAVVAGDRARIETFHDDGFLVTLPDGTLLGKDHHITLEIEAGMKTMTVTALKTRRCGDVILAWARHFLRGTEAPPVQGTRLSGEWVASDTMLNGFEQADFSVWRRHSDGSLKCMAFELTMLI